MTALLRDERLMALVSKLENFACVLSHLEILNPPQFDFYLFHLYAVISISARKLVRQVLRLPLLL